MRRLKFIDLPVGSKFWWTSRVEDHDKPNMKSTETKYLTVTGEEYLAVTQNELEGNFPYNQASNELGEGRFVMVWIEN